MATNTNILYNLVQYLRDELPTEQIYASARYPISGEVPERNALVRETGGSEREVLELTTYQITARDVDEVGARSLAYSIYTLLQSDAKINGRFGLVLPATIVDGVNISSVQTARISAIQRPESLGKNPDGLSEFSMNFQVFL